jgi:ABC-type lipoprotein export system ATPase subunit
MIRLKNVSKYYSKNQTVSLGLRKVNLELGLNEFVAIVGESGSGKTTLLNVISGIDSYEEGEMFINNDETSYYSKSDWENYRKKYIAFIFQNYNLIESYTVLQNVEAALILSGYPKEKLRQRALDIIERVGLLDHIKHKATKLSGGQKQRVVIARAIAKDAPIIVADEPTGNLDSESAKNIIDLLAEIAKEKLVIVVTHDFSQVESQATRRIRIFDGEIVEDKTIEKVDQQPLPALEDKDYQMNAWETTKMVFRNLLATPKKSILLFIIFIFATFFFAFIYAGYLFAQSNQSSYNQGLDFAPESRILVNKTDGTAFTQAELTSLTNNSRIEHLVTFDFLFDRNKQIEVEIGPVFNRDEQNVFLYDVLFMPISMFGSQYDAMPEDEAVVVLPQYAFYEDEWDINGQPIRMNSYRAGLIERYDLTVHEYYLAEDVRDLIYEEYRPVFFVHENTWNQLAKDFGFMFETKYLISDATTGMSLGDETGQVQVVLNTSLDDDEINVRAGSFGLVSGTSRPIDVTIDAFYKSVAYEDITIRGIDLEVGDLEVGQTMYDTFFNPDEIYQVSLFAKDGIDALNFVDEVNTDTYQVYHPASAGAANQLEGLVFLVMNFGMLVLFGVLFLGIFFISYMIIKNIINSKLNDYAIFRTIGANKSTIRSFIYLETLFVAAFAYIVFILFIIIATPFIKEDGFLYVMKFYNFKNVVYLFIFMAAYSFLLSRRYVSRVYHDTVAETLRREME